MVSICIICRYGDMFIGDGIFIMLPVNAYLLFISVSNPPLVGVYGILCCILLVSECVLLKMSLYCGEIFSMYLVDFIAVSFVSWMMIIAGLVCACWIKSCMLGSDDAFHDMIWVLLLMSWFILGGSGEGISSGGDGCMYSGIGSKKFSVSFSKLLDKKENLLFSD